MLILRIRQAECALADGRLDEARQDCAALAHSLATSSELRAFVADCRMPRAPRRRAIVDLWRELLARL